MKIRPSAIPVAVGFVGLAWLGVRQAEIRGLRLEAAMAERRESSVSAGAGPEGARRQSVESERAQLRRWAAALQSGGSGWLRTDLREVDEIESMGRDELIAALDGLPDAGLDESQRSGLERRLLSLLGKIDPEYVTRRYGRFSALAGWAKNDPAGAVTWFDQQVAAGNFKSKRPDGELSEEIELRRALVQGLLASDPAAAERVLLGWPEKTRIDFFRGRRSESLVGGITEEIRLLRKHLPDEDRLGLLTWPLTDKAWKGELGTVDWTELEDYFRKMEATPEERRACLLAVARNGRFPRTSGDYFDVVPEDIEALRTWVAEEDPGLIMEATAGALKRVAGRDDFPFWTEYAVRLHEAGEGDSVLKALLDAHPAGQHPNLARSLAERLPAGEERERYLERYKAPEP